MNWLPDPVLKHLRYHLQLKMVLATFLIYWICMLPVLFGNGTASPAAVRLFVLPAMVTMYWLATSMIDEMAQGVAVFGQLQAPHAFRRRLLTEKLKAVMLGWAFLAGGVSLELALPGSHAAALSGAALISLIACVGVARAMSRAGLYRSPFEGLLAATPVLLCVAVLGLDLPRLLDWFGALPFALHALCALSFPLLALSLWRRWGAELPLFRWHEKQNLHGSWLGLQARRFTILTWKRPIIGAPENPSERSRMLLQAVTLSCPFIFLSGNPVWLDGNLNLPRLLTTFSTIIVVAGALLVRDVHWRSLLQPGGLRRRRIAFSIWSTTVAMQLCVFAGSSMALGALAHAVLGMPVAEVIGHITDHWPLLFELPLVTAAGVLLRASTLTGRPVVTVFAALVLATLFLATISAVIALPHKHTSLPMSLAWFAGASMGVTALLVALASRMWTTQRLFAAAAQTRAD